MGTKIWLFGGVWGSSRWIAPALRYVMDTRSLVVGNKFQIFR
jgi:hypothetical protein